MLILQRLLAGHLVWGTAIQWRIYRLIVHGVLVVEVRGAWDSAVACIQVVRGVLKLLISGNVWKGQPRAASCAQEH